MDLPINPDFPVQETIRHNTLVSEFDNGVEQRRSKWSSPLREWSLTFTNRSQDEHDDLVDFFNTQLGSLTAWAFDNPNDGTEYQVRFKDDSLKVTLRAYQIYNMSVDIIEVK